MIDTDGDSVTVTVRIQVPMHILPIGTKTVSGTSTTRNVRGVAGPET